ncbi:MAG: electron transfer flavoprotein-ubiquinone oxidoreductase [Caedibacter sp. 37-49]|nr:MAG: electron transfer flavoprotein-ubiquinone oxidoreductase [Caedibacter sp. 37-49]
MGDELSFDVVIVGAGPAGLSAAIRLKQLCNANNQMLSVCVLEKGAEVGAHILSGAVLEPRALNELIPDWKEKGAPLETVVQEDKFLLLTQKRSFRLPTPPLMKNHGNYIISLGNFCRWLAQQAEALGAEIYPGFSVGKTLDDDQGKVVGVETMPRGLDANGQQKEAYEPGVQILARHVIFAEGCRGSLSKELFEKFNLRKDCQTQTYGIGLKELWEIKPEKHQQGRVLHTIGWPLDAKTYGGSFIYHLENNQLAIGFVIGLDYENPYLSPYDEFQRFKHHPAIQSLLEGGRRISYGARALNEGGWQSIPQLSFPGGSLIGCAAGFLNVPKIKGTHTAMKSGMIAAEVIFEALSQGREPQEEMLDQQVRQSWIAEELKPVRNIRPGFKKGIWHGLINAAFETVLQGKTPWTLKHQEDHKSLKKAKECQPISYPKPDGVISFDKMSSVYLSNTNHAEDQPCHLHLKQSFIPIAHNLALYDAPEQRYCPAGVYEITQNATGAPHLQINAQNCVHCKTCDIKDPLQNINWVAPEGGDGPRYPNM